MNTLNTHKPHTAVISIQLEVYPLLDTGECAGKIVNPEVLTDYNIDSAFLAQVNGHTLDDCLKKLKEKVDQLREEQSS